MGNLLGDIWTEQGTHPCADLDLAALADNQSVINIVLYGKREARTGRKMGHFITYSLNPDEALSAAQMFKQGLKFKRGSEAIQ
jgi:5-(carboxyamino)imidazole ribonucleotide synthase